MMEELNISSNLLKDFSKTYNGSTILITGGTSFLGKRILPALGQTGCIVTAIGSKDVDLRDINQTMELFSRRFDIVIHAAAVQGGLEFILSNQAQIYLDNQIIHTNVIKACLKYPPKKLIGIGSSCSYPGNRPDLKEEDFWDGRLEKSVFTYGFTKKTLYVGQYSLFKEIRLPGAHLVLNNMYGIGDNFDPKHSHVVAALIYKFSEAKEKGIPVTIWGDGSAEREFLYVDDAVEGILRAIMKINNFELLNIANGKPISIKDLVRIISSVFNYDNFYFDITKPAGAKRKSLNSIKCLSLLGWVPLTELEEGIKKTIEWYLSRR